MPLIPGAIAGVGLHRRTGGTNPFDESLPQARQQLRDGRREQYLVMTLLRDQLGNAADGTGEKRNAERNALDDGQRAILYERGHDGQASGLAQIGQGLVLSAIAANLDRERPLSGSLAHVLCRVLSIDPAWFAEEGDAKRLGQL